MAEKPPEKIYGRDPTEAEHKAAAEWNYKYKRNIVGSAVTYWYLSLSKKCDCR